MVVRGTGWRRSARARNGRQSAGQPVDRLVEHDLSSACMNWHTRYSQQAKWTRDLREYIFEKTDLNRAQRVLEVGCGTGAILSELPKHPNKYGLDIDPAAL